MILTYVKWKDTCSSYEGKDWLRLKDFNRMPPSIVHTTGFLLDEAAEFITLTQSIATNEEDEDSSVSCIWTIPIENIIERKEFPKYEIVVDAEDEG